MKFIWVSSSCRGGPRLSISPHHSKPSSTTELHRFTTDANLTLKLELPGEDCLGWSNRMKLFKGKLNLGEQETVSDRASVWLEKVLCPHTPAVIRATAHVQLLVNQVSMDYFLA